MLVDTSISLQNGRRTDGSVVHALNPLSMYNLSWSGSEGSAIRGKSRILAWRTVVGRLSVPLVWVLLLGYAGRS